MTPVKSQLFVVIRSPAAAAPPLCEPPIRLLLLAYRESSSLQRARLGQLFANDSYLGPSGARPSLENRAGQQV